MKKAKKEQLIAELEAKLQELRNLPDDEAEDWVGKLVRVDGGRVVVLTEYDPEKKYPYMSQGIGSFKEAAPLTKPEVDALVYVKKSKSK